MNEVEIVAADGHVVHGTLYDRNFDNQHVALLIHGITQERTAGGFHANLAEDLSKIGFASLAIDYRGHGASKIQRSDLSLCGIHADVSASLKYIREKLAFHSDPRELMIAFSFGGGIGYLVGQEQGVDAILLNAPVLSYADDIEMAGGADWRYRQDISELPYYDFNLRSDVGAEALVVDAAIERVPPAVRTVIFHGEADSDIPISSSQNFVAARQSSMTLEAQPNMDHNFAVPGDVFTNEDPQSDRNRDIVRNKMLQRIKQEFSV